MCAIYILSGKFYCTCICISNPGIYVYSFRGRPSIIWEVVKIVKVKKSVDSPRKKKHCSRGFWNPAQTSYGTGYPCSMPNFHGKRGVIWVHDIHHGYPVLYEVGMPGPEKLLRGVPEKKIARESIHHPKMINDWPVTYIFIIQALYQFSYYYGIYMTLHQSCQCHRPYST